MVHVIPNEFAIYVYWEVILCWDQNITQGGIQVKIVQLMQKKVHLSLYISKWTKGLDTVHDMHVKYMSVPRSSSDVAYNICPIKYQMHMDGQ